MSSPTVVAVPPSAFPTITARVAEIDAAVMAARGHAALGDAVWRDLERPDERSAALFVPDGDAGDAAFAHVARSDTNASPHWTVGLVVRPDTSGTDVRALLDAATRHVAMRGGGRVVAWVFDATPGDDAAMGSAGFEPARDLYEMRVTLPVTEAVEWPPGIVVRDFEPGRDEQDWLRVNNRAFENHPEQGAWVEATLARRMDEPWFDPSLFILAFDDEGLAGFNWCKIHPAPDSGDGDDAGALGEIFVIGVHPSWAGRGIGRPLALAGLQRMRERGITRGQLFTNADNTRSIKLYEGIGFRVHRIDRSYAREVAPT